MSQRFKRRDLRAREMLLLVALRYGSLTSFDRIVSSYEQVSKQTGLRPHVVSLAIKRWHANGNRYVNHKQGRQPLHGLSQA